MHVFFSGIGGTAIGPLALIAKQAGYDVSGSDKQKSQYTDYLISKGLDNIKIGQTKDDIASTHSETPIDWYVYSSAVEIEQPNAPEFEFCRQNNIKMTKRDDFLNHIIQEKNLKLIAVAGTHGKTTTTAMAIWVFKQLRIPLSWSVGAKISFGDMGQYDPKSEYFVLETDEFDRNFLSFNPHLSLITGVTWDHHEIFPTKDDYRQAFQQFVNQSNKTYLWFEDSELFDYDAEKVKVLESTDSQIDNIDLLGHYNRLDAWLVINAVHEITGVSVKKLVEIMGTFPGLQRRMEKIKENLYSDYAHTPEKIRGAMSAALETASKNNQKVVVVYEPLTNRRQHHMKNDYKGCFEGAEHVYWIPSYLAREDPNQTILEPKELVNYLADPSIATPRKRDESLRLTLQQHLDNGDMVVCMAGGGGDSLDEWLRDNFVTS